MIAEIETDKATMEVEAVDEGTLGKILMPEGTNDVAVNTPIATILGDGESAADADKASAAHERNPRKRGSARAGFNKHPPEEHAREPSLPIRDDDADRAAGAARRPKFPPAPRW